MRELDDSAKLLMAQLLLGNAQERAAISQSLYEDAKLKIAELERENAFLKGQMKAAKKRVNGLLQW